MTTKTPEGTPDQSRRYMAGNNPNAIAELRARAEAGQKLTREERRKLKRQK